MITTTPRGAQIRATCSTSTTCRVHVAARPADRPTWEPPGSPSASILVQPFGGYHELQIAVLRPARLGRGQQCPQANIYGHHAGNYDEDWEQPWLPVPVLGDVAGYDRPVQFDVYASTERVYVFMDDKPAGCARAAGGAHAGGPGHRRCSARVLYHCGIDESVDAGRHRPPVPAQLQPLALRPPLGRPRHRSRRAGAGLGRDDACRAAPLVGGDGGSRAAAAALRCAGSWPR